ncbi:hypothetical protein [Galactobacter valiniphilus]|uniref:hypothetical protein n=1 Tax=Galactobacter valiniphilus TaxID=2676122 RepID=UPI0037366ABB
MAEFDLLSALQAGGTPAPGHPAAAPDPGEHPPCSRKGCRTPAAWALLWNNPRLHTPERRKTWLACEEHRVWLADYLSTRGFLREVTPFRFPPQEG